MPVQRVSSQEAISKDEFHDILRSWLRLNEARIGPADVDGRTRWLHIVDNAALYSIHADAKREGVVDYLNLVDRLNGDVTWSRGEESRAVLFGPEHRPITPLYLYVENDAFTGTWKAAVRRALFRFSKRHQTHRIVRQQFLNEELSTVKRETRAKGNTPSQTMSRVLQELRDEGLLLFVNPGEYLLNSGPIDIGAEELPDDAVDAALLSGNAQFTDVETTVSAVVTRQRVGQAALRRFCLKVYQSRCAFCAVADPRLLTASHIVRWADDVSCVAS
ncbi:hypothetical protein [Nitrospira sp. Ecomares 2.1]